MPALKRHDGGLYCEYGTCLNRAEYRSEFGTYYCAKHRPEHQSFTYIGEPVNHEGKKN